ncbi:hypothetical protein [Helicobacter bilis]|uniref:hypothetical protein n=1 Tax=Helicobacter bilis TaxID=37372 RepID=UPI000B20FFCB|nr:hypothetical protein [Helicobacter bilis]
MKKAEYILNSTGFNHAMIFNCNESLQIERKGENVEIVRHFEKQSRNKGTSRAESKAEAGLKTPRNPAPPKFL